MALSIAVGSNARAAGICTVAIGDTAVAVGAFQVVVQDEVSLPTLPVERYQEFLDSFTTHIAIFEAMAVQGHAPASFAKNAKEALTNVSAKIKEHMKTMPNALPAATPEQNAAMAKATEPQPSQEVKA
jgi:hypothetical protein